MLSYYHTFPRRPVGVDDFHLAIQRSWPTFHWGANPWIRDLGGHMLTRAKYDRIAVCSLAALNIVRTGPVEFVLTVPVRNTYTALTRLPN